MTEKTLSPGMCLLLPSKNIIQLVRRELDEWVCVYTEVAKARGEVLFSDNFLLKHGQIV